MFKITIMGEPIAQGRPRFSKRGANTVVYDPPKSKAYKNKIKKELESITIEPFIEPIRACFNIYVPIPKSYTKKQRRLIEEGSLQPGKKPDLSNYIKLIEDAANGVLYTDDSLIVEITAKKVYSEEPRIELSLEAVTC